MSIVLEVLEKSRKPIPRVAGRTPRLRVQCETCGRIYVTNAWPTAIRKQKGCCACVPRNFDDREFAKAMAPLGAAETNRRRKENTMTNKNTGSRRKRVWIPDDVREAVKAIYDQHVPGKGRLRHAGKVLGVAECTITELMAPGGAVQQKTLDRVKARLAELAASAERGAA